MSLGEHAIPVRNTFVHFEEDECSPVRHTKSDSAALTGHGCFRRPRRAVDLELFSDLTDSGTETADSQETDGAQGHFYCEEGSTSTRGPTPTGTGDDELVVVVGAGEDDEPLERISRRPQHVAVLEASAQASAQVLAKASAKAPALAVAAASDLSAAISLHAAPPCGWAVMLPAVPCLLAGCTPVAQARVAMRPATESAAWEVSAEQVEGTENKVESGLFLVNLPGAGHCPFQITLYAGDSSSQRGRGLGFLRSRGRGRLEVKCHKALPRGTGQVALRVCVGSGHKMQPQRPPVPHDFSSKACCGWRKWNFASAVEPMTRTFTVRVSFEPLGSPRSSTRVYKEARMAPGKRKVATATGKDILETIVKKMKTVGPDGEGAEVAEAAPVAKTSGICAMRRCPLRWMGCCGKMGPFRDLQEHFATDHHFEKRTKLPREKHFCTASGLSGPKEWGHLVTVGGHVLVCVVGYCPDISITHGFVVVFSLTKGAGAALGAVSATLRPVSAGECAMQAAKFTWAEVPYATADLELVAGLFPAKLFSPRVGEGKPHERAIEVTFQFES